MKYNKNVLDIKKDIEEIFEINDLSLRYRGRELVMYRYLYMTLCRKFTNKSLAKIANPIGLKHCEVLHGLKQFEILLPYYKDVNYIFMELDKIYTNEYYQSRKLDTVEVVHCDLLNGKILTEIQFNKFY